MTAILTALHLDSPDSLKRAISSALGFLALALINPFLVAKGLPPVSDTALAAAAVVLSTFILQSGVKAAAVAHGEAQVVVAQVGAKAIIDAAIKDGSVVAP